VAASRRQIAGNPPHLTHPQLAIRRRRSKLQTKEPTPGGNPLRRWTCLQKRGSAVVSTIPSEARPRAVAALRAPAQAARATRGSAAVSATYPGTPLRRWTYFPNDAT